MRSGLKRLPLLVLMVAIMAGITQAQEEILLRITQLDSSSFPLVRVNVITSDAQSAPLSDLSGLSLRENGIPIGDLEFSQDVVGANLIFVLDANSSFQQSDGNSSLTRQEIVKDSITRFADRFMDDTDRVAIVVPDDGNVAGRFLVEHATSSQAVVSAIGGYEPETQAAAPIHEMMLLALAHAADDYGEGRFQAVILFSDGAQLRRQLNVPVLVEQARRIDVPIFVAILGERADPVELENAALLYGPTRATYVHVPDAASTDPVYTVWQSQRSQTQISYRSLQTRSGRYPITINLGSARATAEFTLAIAPPELAIELDEAIVRRVGDAPDTPLTSLEPGRIPVRVKVNWPDDSPRSLAAINLFVNGQSQPMVSIPELDANGVLTLEWNVAGLDQGEYTLVVQLVDELGLSAVSDAYTVSLEVERPLPPTATPLPTAPPEPSQQIPAETTDGEQERALPFLAAIALLVVALLLVRRRRHRTVPEAKSIAMEAAPPAVTRPTEPVEQVPQIAFLEMLEAGPSHVARIRIEGDTVSIGRDHQVAQIVFAEPSVARLHARIKRRDGDYWLYDEGSAEGTYHNYRRLGLTAQLLEDQDTIHFGKVGVRFHLQQLSE